MQKKLYPRSHTYPQLKAAPNTDLAAASASSRHAGRHETSIDGGGEQAHRSLKHRGSPPLESRGSKRPPQARRPQPLRPPFRRASPRAVAAPSPAFSSRQVSQFSNFNLRVHTCIRRPGCAARESGPLLYDNSVPCISEIHSEFSDSIHFMQFHTEFQYDPAQDRRAGRAGQQRLEFMMCGSLRIRGTFFPASW
eukprot:COSAG02_NODE_141_length_34311_cov_54.733135_7_plen_194_part_00